ncbi:uncharacterized protein LOC132203613 isoform X2 [Neocloeon triangulifer]|uniref:uncharacterized protein LOC132203613 isoform X2 n=1 Tax=Neocloeon triangulifer TaxID=2078957 RepID=UPI00286F80DB|nr:uncharacterized protein LOC132203613 isoform X2 [Neocloeon triangulifer]
MGAAGSGMGFPSPGKMDNGDGGADDTEARIQKMRELRKKYLAIIETNIGEQKNREMHEAAKKLSVLRNIITNEEEIPHMPFLERTEGILQRLDSRRPKLDTTNNLAPKSDSGEDCQIIEVKRIQNRHSLDSCPRSPSPELEKMATPQQTPKLIPVEKRSSILSLPMPRDDSSSDDDSVRTSPGPPILPQPIANLIQGVSQFGMRRDMDMHTHQEPETHNSFEPAEYFEAPSPPQEDIELNSDDDDDLVIDEGSFKKSPPKETLHKQLPPLLPPPKPPAALTIGMKEFASLADNATLVARQEKSTQESPNPADDFIPGRQMSRVHSSLMASKTGTTKPMPSPRPSSVRVAPSPAFTLVDLFSPEAPGPKYQFGAPSKPVSICPPQPRSGPESPNATLSPPATAARPPITLSDFVPPQQPLFAPPQRTQPPQPRDVGSRDPRQRISHPPQQQQNCRNIRDPRTQERPHNSKQVAIVKSQPPKTYREHKAMKAEEERRMREERNKQRREEMSLAEKKRLELDEKRRKEAAQRQEDRSNQERLLQRKTELVKVRSLAKPTSRVQVIDPLPAPASEIKKIPRRASEDRRSSTDSDSGASCSKEKNVDKSLEKTSPLNSLYGEMPQPSKNIFRIPKKPTAQRAKQQAPPQRKRSASPPPPDIGSDDENNSVSPGTPPRDDSDNSLDEVVKRDNIPLKVKPAEEMPAVGTGSSDKIIEIKEHIRSMVQAQTNTNSSAESSLTNFVGLNKSHLEQIIRSVVQEELNKIKATVSVPLAESTPSTAQPEIMDTSDSSSITPLADNSASESPTIPPAKEKAEVPKTVTPPIPIPADVGSPEVQKPVDSSKNENFDLKTAVENEVRKQKAHKKSELDKLQDDLRDSFISEGVMSATGARTRHPVMRYSAPLAKEKEAAREEQMPAEIKEMDHDSENALVALGSKNLVVRLERLSKSCEEENSASFEMEIVSKFSEEGRTAPIRKAVAKRGKAFGQASRPSSSCTETALVDETDSDLTSLASEDSSVSGCFPDFPTAQRGSPSGRRGRGRGRGGKGRRNIMEGYAPREDANLTDASYTWKPLEILPCKICMYEGKKIVDHYITVHPDSEVLISRLPNNEAIQAVLQPNNCKSPVLQCRFCKYNSTKLTEFYDHVTEHTGEYRLKCAVCPFKRPKKDAIIYHTRKQHRTDKQAVSQIDMQGIIEKNCVTGYLCGFCNFVQLSEATVTQHIELRHRHEVDAVCRPGMDESNEINMSRVESQEDELEEAPSLPEKMELVEIEGENEKNEEKEEPVEDHNFMTMLDDLIHDQPKNQLTGKSFLESIRRSKTKIGEESEVKKIEIARIPLSSTPRPIREVTPEPPLEYIELDVIESPQNAKLHENRKRNKMIVGICYACGHTEGHDINNLFRHMKDTHPPEKRGNCPDCSRPLSGTDKAIRHMIEEHVPMSVRDALLDFWKPMPSGRNLKSIESLDNASDAAKKAVSDYVDISSDEQPKAFQHARTVKNSAVYASMLEPGRLQKMYKCMARNCSFSSVIPEKFIKHIDKHKSLSVGRIKDWQECVYCMELYGSGQQLIDHIHKEHNKFVFQCSLCFFRAATDSHVFFHQKIAHSPEEGPKTYVCQKEQPKVDQPPFVGVIGKFILPFICSDSGCGITFYKTDEFMDHFAINHPNMKEFLCHECNASSSSIVDLIEHYKDHIYCEFHCLLCKYGSDEQRLIYNHMCKHANHAPCYAVRHLLGSKTEKNLLAGALRRMEIKTVTSVYQPPVESEESESDDEDLASKSSESLRLSAPKPVFSRTLSAIEKTLASAATPFSRLQNVIETTASTQSPLNPWKELPSTSGTNLAATPTHVASSFPTLSATISRLKDSDAPVAPPPVTLPLSTFSRTVGSDRPYENDEGESRVTNLSGHRLYICCKPGCDFTSEKSSQLNDHLIMCDCTILLCFHCKKPFKQVSPLVEHLKIVHGPLRYTCGVCTEFKSANINIVKKHLKQSHSVYQVIVKANDPYKTDQDEDQFTVLPKIAPIAKPANKPGSIKRYGPGDEKELPSTPIFQDHVQCSICTFKTRVKINFLRHIREHEEKGDQASSASIPINPMPCLKANEKHFDKMNNWAQSSHVSSDGTPLIPVRRSSQELPAEVVSKLPRYIVEMWRYACGVPNCSYKCSDVEMLAMHLENLHPDTEEFLCVHCPSQDWQLEQPDLTLIKKSVQHMKQHGPNLFVCLICKHVDTCKDEISKHTNEEHEIENSFQVIREETLDEEGATWCCSECKQTRFSLEDIKSHCSSVHNINYQFRCSLCSYRAPALPHIFENHFPKEHPGKIVHAIAAFYPIGYHDPRVSTGVSTLTPADSETVRHIRMIRIEEVGGKEKKTPAEKKRTPVKGSGQKLEDIMGLSKPFPEPDGLFYVCPQCTSYKNRQKSKMEEHIYKHFQYKKFTCSECNISVVSKLSMQTHLQKIHHIDADLSKHILVNDGRQELEDLVKEVLQYQSDKMPVETFEPVIVDSISLQPEQPKPGIREAYAFADDVIMDFSESESEPSTSGSPVKVYHDTPSVRKKSMQKVGSNVCKHCMESFKTLMALMMHIRLFHFKSGKFVCAYCAVSANSVNIINKHSMKKHPTNEPKAVENPDWEKITFDERFWSDNYGIYLAKDGWKMRESEQLQLEQPAQSVQFDCRHCDFRTLYAAALKRHSVTHKFTYGCGICNNFESEHSADVRNHSQQKHPNKQVDVQQILQGGRPSKVRKLDDSTKIKLPSTQAINSVQPATLVLVPSVPLPQVSPVVETPLAPSPAILTSITPCTSPAPSAPSPVPSTSSLDQQAKKVPLLYTCNYCKNVTEDKLKKLLKHWEETHKETGHKFSYTHVKAGKKCIHCNMVFSLQKNMDAHFIESHPQYVNITFKIYKCKICAWRSDSQEEVFDHILLQHAHVGSDPSVGCDVEKKLLGYKQVWCYCLHCQKFDSDSEQSMIEHCKTMHSDLSPRFAVFNEKKCKVVREIGRADDVKEVTMKAHPHVKTEAQAAAEAATSPALLPGVRRQYVCPCPPCPEKKKTLKGMEEHVREFHARLWCVDCKQVLLNDIAAKMHHLVEHREPGSNPSQNIIKFEDDVKEYMKSVRREGDELAAGSPVVKAEK